MTIAYTRQVDPRSPLGKGIILLFLGLGILMLLAAGILFGVHRAQQKGYVKTEAEIVSVDADRHPTVLYEANGRMHKHFFQHFSSTTFRTGKKLTVAYDPTQPDTVVLAGAIGLLAELILGFIGCVFSAVGGICLHIFHGKRRKSDGL